MLIPILVTAGIAGAMYAFGRTATPVSGGEPAAPTNGQTPAQPAQPPVATLGDRAQVGDTVEVGPEVLMSTLSPNLPADTTITKFSVSVTDATPTDLRGNIISFSAFGGPPTSPTITTTSVDNVPTPSFPRAAVQRVLRNGMILTA
jgi:hypothetical protein